MEPDLRRHLIALLELGLKYNENGGMTEGRLSQLERDLSLTHEKMREAIKQLGAIGAIRIIIDDPKLPYGVRQAFVTDAGKLYLHTLVEETRQVVGEIAPIEIQDSLRIFKKDHPDPTKVGFIMMKFEDTPAHNEISKAIKSSLREYGLEGIRSDDREYHKTLLYNVETYMHGCGFGVAVFDRIKEQEFSPNVSLEVGYMMALRKHVCLLKDETLRTLHADLLGELYKPFDPQDPEKTIPYQLSKWLSDKGIGTSKPPDFPPVAVSRVVTASPATVSGTITAPPIRPPLKWAGGKRWLVPYLRPIWEPYKDRRLVEPLCGGLAVTLGLMPTRALLNDINTHAMNFFQWLKKGLVIAIPMENSSKLYYAHRKRFNGLIKIGEASRKEAAELFYYLNRTCYNGLCRFNKSGEFNVPFGQYQKINYIRDFAPYKQVFREWEFTTGDFENVILAPDDFVYADPPYDVEFTQYSREGFSWEDQVRLAKWLTRHSGPVILSNQATQRICKLYSESGYELRFLDAPRMISCKGDRTPAREVMALRGI